MRLMRTFNLVVSRIAFLLLLSSMAFAQNMFRKVSDFDGDGRADFAVTRNEFDGKYWYVWQTTAGFKVFRWGIGDDIPTAGDYDGDGKTDFAVFRDSTSFPIEYSYHFLESSTGNYIKKTFSAFANFGAYRVHQDYNGDGKVDAAINNGEFGGQPTTIQPGTRSRARVS